jgi:Icc-related predicted phosphoesterase
VQPLLVSSIIKDPAAELSSLVVLASRGELIFGPHTGQIGYAPFRMPRFATELEIKSNMETVLQRLKNSEIEIDLPKKK